MVSFSTLFVGAVALAAQSVSAGPTKPAGLVPRTFEGQKYGCKCYPGDDCWPQQSEWDSLNAKVNGNLHVHVPPEAACHNTFDGLLGSQQTYDAAKCAEVTKSWTSETWTVDQEALNIWKYFTNVTCLPTTDPSQSCTLGFYGVYVIMAKTKDHIKAGVNFARDHNLRLVIRNTGHDFVGRSTGWGSLIINTHSFQDIKFHSKWSGAGAYKGGAVTVGAGVQGVTILEAAQKQNPKLTLVTGECKTVGLAGGYVAGGGHGPLTSAYGMAADNTLEFEVITAKGDLVVANEKVNADLYFALRGGGPSTYGVVTSIFPFTFHARPFVAVGKTKDELDAILKPLLDELNAAGVPFTSMTKGYPYALGALQRALRGRGRGSARPQRRVGHHPPGHHQQQRRHRQGLPHGPEPSRRSPLHRRHDRSLLQAPPL
ncbi:FAD binding domain-containing protein [Verticillium alfalfae VaMs.102]|uniref:FAD binding domain-containing protein n=1 Tax=Verticillium alfalfae (strain VaMs.102 / ATCC MYA-4576 / FGSC 10136) TaxID=526221 RepID=C9SRU8_VERA1|nr:FAD binding domain-containing protein [Verticillium alfalfae VaMs.102]EEY21513.1 FAD binding domain-containing protein [Verticillium alfalfae VaMs.102]